MTRLLPVLAVLALVLGQSSVADSQSSAPAKPTGLQVTLSGDRAVLTWTDPGGSADVTGYNIYRSFDISHLVTLRIIREKVTTYTDKWPSQGQVNVYAIRAVNSTGESPLSDPVYIAPPARPDNLSATVANSGVTLRWEQPEMQDWVAEADMTITGYQVLRGTSPDNLSTLRDNTGNANTTYEDTTTRPAGGVYYAVRARTATGMSLPSEPLSVGAPDPVDASDGNTLILASNWRLGNAGGNFTGVNAVTVGANRVSEPFRSGPSNAGYTIEEVTVDVASVTGQPMLQAAIHADTPAGPGAALHTLSVPATLAVGSNTLTAPTQTRIEPNTKYWVVFRATGGAVALQLSNFGARDNTAARGFRLFQQNALYSQARPIRIMITGQDRDDVPADATTRATLRVGHTVRSAVHGYGDRDWYRIRLTGGTEYRFDDVVEHTSRATVLAIYDEDDARQTVSKFLHGLPDVLRRVYFTPAATGNYYIAVGTLEHAYGSADAPGGERNYGEYGVRAMLADPEAEGALTGASVSPGSPYRGDLFTPHDGKTDVDWIRIHAQAGERYQLVLLSDARVKTSITNIYDPLGNPVPGFEATSSPARKPLFYTDPQTGLQTVSGYGHHDSYGYWIETIFEAKENGPHHIVITGGPDSYTQGPQLGSDGQPLPGATWSTIEWDFYGADYTLYVWSTTQREYGEPQNTDTSTAGTLTPTRLDAAGGDTSAGINHPGDVDWFTTWMEAGEQYALFLDKKGTDAQISSIFELPWPSLSLPGHSSEVVSESTGLTSCHVHIHRARRDGVHFVAVTGQTTGQYALSATRIRPELDYHHREATDRDECAGATYLLPNQHASGDVPDSDVDALAMPLRAGQRYKLSINIDNRTDTRLRHPDGTNQSGTRPLDSPDNVEWNIAPARDGIYIIRIDGQSVHRLQPYTANLTNRGSASLPVANIYRTETEINEGDDTVFRVELENAWDSAVDVGVNLRTNFGYPKLEGSATRTVTIPRGATSQTITVTSIDDDIVAQGVTIVSRLTAGITPSEHYRIGQNGNATTTILDGTYVDEMDEHGNLTGQQVFEHRNDTVTVSWPNCGSGQTVSRVTVQEDAGTVGIPLTVVQGRVAFEYSWVVHSNNGTATRINDFTVPGSLTFAPLGRESFLPVHIVDRDQLEDTEKFTVLVTTSGLPEEVFLTTCDTLEITIEDDDVAQTTISAQSDRVDEGDDIVLTIRPHQGPIGEFVVPFPVYAEITPTGDTAALANPAAQVVHLPPGLDSRTVTFTAVDDAIATGDRSVTFEVTRMGTVMDFSATDDRLLLPEDTVTVTIAEEETPVVNIFAVRSDINEGDEVRLRVQLGHAWIEDLDVSVSLETTYGYPMFSGGAEHTVTIPAGTTARTLAIASLEDDVLVTPSGPSDTLTARINPGTDYAVGQADSVEVTITDGSYVPELDGQGDPTGNTVFDPMDDAVVVSWPNCGSGQTTAQMTLTEDAGAVTIPVTTIKNRAAYDYNWLLLTISGSATRDIDVTTPATVDIPATSQQVTIVINIVDDTMLEDTETFTLVLSRGSLREGAYKTTCGALEISIQDNDVAQTSISAENEQVTEGDDIVINVRTHEGVGDCDLAAPVYAEVTPTGDTNGLTDSAAQVLRIPGCVDEGSLTFATANDTTVTADRSVTFEVTRLGTSMDFSATDERLLLPQDTVTVTITDDDGSQQQREATPPADTDSPALQSATVDGSSLVLSFDEDLDFSRTPSSSLFTVNVNGTSRPVLGTGGGGTDVTLLLFTAVEYGDTVTVSYTAPTDAKQARVQDLAGNAAASFSGETVTNDTAPSQTQGDTETIRESGEVANTPASGTPAINGTAQVGQRLTVDTSGITDADGLTNVSFVYQWLADETAIPNADASTYTLTSSEQGKAIKVRVSFTDDRGHAETLTSAATVAVAARPNTPAAGTPTIIGTAQVGQRLTADTSDISDDDGLTNVSFAYQWLADDRLIWGARDSSYTLVDADEDSVIKVRVSFTDDRGHAETLTSAATVAVAAAPAETPAFTASAIGLPASHDGASTFTFELRFSEAPVGGFSYKVLRDHAFTVTGGEVVKARRLERPANIRWEIHVLPDGDGRITIVLPATTDCTAQGAICAPDGRMLSGDLEVSVPGPGG